MQHSSKTSSAAFLSTRAILNDTSTYFYHYLLPEGTNALPDFSTLESVGNVYTSVFNISPRSFTEGFPGLTDRFEWFAIDYQGTCNAVPFLTSPISKIEYHNFRI